VLLAGLTTGHKIGIGVVALVFISFALLSSFYAPRRRPDFPGKNGLSVFVVVSLALFFAMVSAVIVFGRESEAKGAGEKAAAKTIAVRETEYKIRLASSTVPAGAIAFDVVNAGRIPHDLTIQGSKKGTPTISPGVSATLTVTLKPGTYTLYCSVPGHRKLGMVAKLTVT
jgi:plastocyanin